MNLFPFFDYYTENIFLTDRQPAFVVLLSFIITFLITRAYTRIARNTGWGSASFGGVHTHHLVFGLIMAFLSGALTFAFYPEINSVFNLFLAALFGSGAALVLDEFALVFHLEDVYWEEEGRKSIDAVLIGLALGTIFLLQVSPFAQSNPDITGVLLFVTYSINIMSVVISAIKGKNKLALFGIFIPFLAQIGAIRIAKPNSIWANKFYTKNKTKRKKSKNRYKYYAKKYGPIKKNLWDLIGGEVGRRHKKK